MRTPSVFVRVVGTLPVALAMPALSIDYSATGPFKAGSKTVTVKRPNNSTFQAVLYYPATATGPNAPIDPSGAPYAGITFGHGFLQPVDRYTSTLEHLATWGFLTIASTSEGGLFPSHANFALDMRHCLTHLEADNNTPGSMLFGLVDLAAFGASGHSMGGGCSILATAADARIRAVANLAAANTNPSAVGQMDKVQVPACFIVGSADGIVPPANTLPFFNAGSTPRLFMSIQGGWHCGFQDVSSFGCDSGPMSRSEQLKYTRSTLTSFFMLTLKDDQGAWRQVWGPEQKADPKLLVMSDAGLRVDIVPGTVSAFGGKQAHVVAAVLNESSEPIAFEMMIEGDWTAQTNAGFQELLPGASLIVDGTIDVPEGFSSDQGEIVLSARWPQAQARAYATLTVQRQCLGDFDNSGALSIDDFIAYQTAFAIGDLNADVDNDGSLSIDDFIGYQTAYALGCF